MSLSPPFSSMRWATVARVTAMLVLICLFPLVWDLASWTVHGGKLSLNPMRHILQTETPQPIAISKNSSLAVRTDPAKRAKAAIVVLARNKDLDGVVRSMQRMEARFNRRFQYPYVFLNEVAFDDEFKAATSEVTQARTLYGLIPQDHWSLPDWLTEAEFQQAKDRMRDAGVLYADKSSYHYMCRFYSGFFHLHPLLSEFDYYWRMEPDVHYYCDLDYDPFVFMEERGIQYGFVITVLELNSTIPTLWNTTRAFMAQNPAILPRENLLDFVTADAGSDYNLCHFWSNFEIGNLNFLRSKQYAAYFKHLDQANGFFMERWGDAPVHSLAAAMFLNKSQVHHFSDIGYRHNSFTHCPARMRTNCACDAMQSVQFHTPSFGICHKRWSDFMDKPPHPKRLRQRV